jgi:hypothetical protein
MAPINDSILERLPYRADYIDSLPAYNTWVGNIERLDLVRDILQSNGYRYQGIVFPTRDAIVTNNYATYGLPPYSQQDGILSVGRGSVLVSLAAYCSDPVGFKYSIFDHSAKNSIIDGQSIRADCLGFVTSSSPMDAFVPTYLGPLFMDVPYVLTGDGSVAIRVNNLSSGYNIAQLLLNFAVPKNLDVIKTTQRS